VTRRHQSRRPTHRRSQASGARPIQAPPRSPLSVVWQAPFLTYSGYGDEARGFITALRGAGVPVTARYLGEKSHELISQLERTDPTTILGLKDAVERPVEAPYVNVMHIPGVTASPSVDATANVCRTMFETDRIPASWLPALAQMDEIWVPCQFNVDTFRGAGVAVPIHVVPGGIDARRFRPGLAQLPELPTAGTVFLSTFQWSFRKGPDVLLRAWAHAFQPSDDVVLVIRSYPLGDEARAPRPGIIDAKVDDELVRLGTRRADVAPIVVVDRHLDMAELPRLYASADVYVCPSRGEGWGRPMMEAMACGLATVATRWSGQLEFMDDDNSRLIDVAGIVPVDDRTEFDFFLGHRWAEPSAEHLVEILRQLAADATLRRRLGARARRDVEQRWQWHRVVRHVTDRVDAIAATLAPPAAVPLATRGPSSARATRIAWHGPTTGNDSLSLVNRSLLQHLVRDHRVEVVGTGGTLSTGGHRSTVGTLPAGGTLSTRGTPATGDLSSVAQVAGSDADIVVRHSWPPRLQPGAGQPVAVILPWEYGGLPAAWVRAINAHVADVWCPSTWLAQCYVRSGVDDQKVHVVPNGVDTTVFRPDGPRLPLATRRTCRLLFVGGAIARKGIDLLLDTYLRTFTRADDVCLVVKSFGSASTYRQGTLDTLVERAAADPDAPEIELIRDDTLTDAQMAALYRSCTALVHPYRGEGFGMPIAEAMACGLPVITTNYGACLDFCSDATAELIPASIQPQPLAGVGPSPIGYWLAEPRGDVLADVLRRVVADPSALDARIAPARQVIVERFTWAHAAQAAADRLVALTGSDRAAERVGALASSP
jgi:glycosyltransferase involved in cell wall biosynthesis